MSISSLTSSLYPAQQLGGLQGIGLQALSNAKTKTQNSTSALGNSNPVDLISLSPEAQALIAANNANTANAAAANGANAAVTPVATTPTQSSNTAANTSAPTQAFMKFAKETPAQRMYDQILASLGLTQQQLDAMGPDQRKAVEDKIKDLIKQKMSAQTGVPNGSGAVANSPAAVAISSTN